MTKTIELIPVGDGLGIILTPDMLEKLGLAPGGSVSVSETASGIELRKPDDELAKQMEIARRVMDRRKELLSKLAE